MAEQSPGGFGNVPHIAEGFGKVPNGAEEFRTFRNGVTRTEQHTLTVREVARLFEQAGVPRTERSIINWCQQNHQGIARLDAFFDTNERKYFITPQSVTAAIGEEQSKAGGAGVGGNSAAEQEVRKATETPDAKSVDAEEVKSFELKIRDLEITNRAKDYFIDELKAERQSFQRERKEYVQQLIASSRELGQLRSKLLLAGDSSTDDEFSPHLPGSSNTALTDAPWDNPEK